jgi:hypothetical protein
VLNSGSVLARNRFEMFLQSELGVICLFVCVALVIAQARSTPWPLTVVAALMVLAFYWLRGCWHGEEHWRSPEVALNLGEPKWPVAVSGREAIWGSEVEDVPVQRPELLLVEHSVASRSRSCRALHTSRAGTASS